MSATIFVSGATGVLGCATIPVLVARGYGVRALSRSESRRLSNRRFKEVSGWSPSVPTAMEGVARADFARPDACPD